MKFINLREQTIDIQDDYENLFDAIRVAKETNIGPDRTYRVAISNERFNEVFFTLLTSGYIYAGTKSTPYPYGDVMVMLLSVNADGSEQPVYSSVAMVVNNPKIPSVPEQKISELSERSYVVKSQFHKEI
ncbi:hypothetical protein [Streptomyces hebeiensis]